MMYSILLIFHIVLGTVALISGAWASLSPKKKGKHSSAGRVFVAAMLGSSTIAIFITLIKTNVFLQAVGLFTIYMTLMGFAAFKGHRAKKFLPYLGVLISIYLLISAFAIKGSLNIVALVFGLAQMVMAVADAIGFTKKKVVLHASRMGGAYIAAITAFVVTALDFLPWYLAWFAPSIVGSILISKALSNFFRPKKIINKAS